MPKVAESKVKKLVYVSGLVKISMSVLEGVTVIDQPCTICCEVRVVPEPGF